MLWFMIIMGEVIDVFTYNSLINVYCLQNQMNEAMRVFNFMVSEGFLPDVIVFTSLIHGWCKNKTLTRLCFCCRKWVRWDLHLMLLLGALL